jgi:hypothetical protein
MLLLSPESPMAKAHQLRIEVHNLRRIAKAPLFDAEENNVTPSYIEVKSFSLLKFFTFV